MAVPKTTETRCRDGSVQARHVIHDYTCTAVLTKTFASLQKISMVILTNKNGYLSCTFVLSTLSTEQRYKVCKMCRISPRRD